YWDGRIANSTFVVRVPQDAAAGGYEGTATFWVHGIKIAKLHAVLEVGKGEDRLGRIVTEEERVRSAFASYASEDREGVLARVQGIKKVLPDLDVFLDVLSLRSGQNWAERLVEEIRRRNI